MSTKKWDEIWENNGKGDKTLAQLSGFVRDTANSQTAIQVVSTILKSVKGRKVLEFGCGAGRLAEIFFKQGYDYTGIERSSNMIEQYKKRFPDASIVRSTDLLLPFADNSFDLVFCYSVIQYLDGDSSFAKLLTEMKRVSKGVIFLGDIETHDHTRDYDQKLYKDTPHYTLTKKKLTSMLTGLYHTFNSEYVYLDSRYNCVINTMLPQKQI